MFKIPVIQYHIHVDLDPKLIKDRRMKMQKTIILVYHSYI